MEKRPKMSRCEKQAFAKRSPLQPLKGLQIHKSKTSTISSSSSASVSFEAPPTGCSRSLLSLSSSSRTHLQPTISSSKPRSKENEAPKIPFSLKSTKAPPLRLDKKANRKPTIRNGQRSELCSSPANPARFLKRGPRISERKSENRSGESPIVLFGVSDRVNSNCTPVGKFTVCGLDSVSLDYNQNVNGDLISKTANGKNSDNETPPPEASVSPEIQNGSRFKMPVMELGATPVCYGAGHLLSGVTDKRKCRRRGSLRGGCEKINFFHDEVNCENELIGLQDSLVPLPAEASIRWVLSPCHEDRNEKTPNSVSNGNSEIENNSAVSFGSLSSGNIIQTPSSNSSSYGCLGGSKAEHVQFELDSLEETLNIEGSLASGASLKCADTDLSSSIGLSRVQENVNSLCSWVSDSTVENFTLSQTRISWRDGFFSRIDENNEIDDDAGCGGVKENDLILSSCLKSCPVTEFGKNEENDTIIYKDGLNESAESICTNGGNLVASSDSDCMNFRENHLF